MYYLPEPPYFLVLAGLFIGITCGVAFEATLKQKVKQWLKNPASTLEDLELQLPFLGICLGICIFLEAGLEVFLLNPWIAYAVALPMTIFMGALLWIQLDQVLKQLKEGGSKSIDLDIF